MMWIKELYGTDKPIIAMLHLLPMPGDPNYDPAGGVEKVIERARRDLHALQNGGVDAILVCNEYSLPYLYDVEPYEVDGLVPDIPGVSLVVFGADCLPVLFYDPVRRVAAAAHAGWRGTAAGIVERAVEKMAFYGSRPEDILAAIGPGISRCCFETHEDVPNAMTSALGVCATPYIDPIENGKFKVDLKGINAMRLERAGLLPEHIAVSGDCTACHPEKYWSHRVTNGVRGSQAAVIELLK